MQIVRTDNFNRSGEQVGYDEEVIARRLNPSAADRLTHLLDRYAEQCDCDYHYKTEPDGYQPLVFEP